MERELTVFVTGQPDYYTCEECGETYKIEGMINNWHYCPNCGREIGCWEEV
jgi:PHP family Zn ribbon phosphoesterase